MSPTETVPTPVDVFDIILGYREASELISFAEDMKKRALHAALETARYALKKWDKDGISIQSSLEKCFCTIPMGGVQPFVRYRHPFQPPLFRSVRAVLQRHRMEVLSGRYRTERCHRASRTVHRHPCAVFRQMILDLCVKKGE